MDLKDLTIKKLHEGLVAKEFSAREIAEGYFAHIHKRDKEIGAYLHLMEEDALREADNVDGLVAAKEYLPPLAGVPMAVKDVILIEGHPMTAGSKILEHYTASYDAGAIARLKSQHAVFLGKTNLDEFAMGTSTENSGFHPTRNPRDVERVPGGSSGGSAAAVAGDMALGALGSDTGGSIRQPAAFCGIVGLKPTYGAVSRSGLSALASSLDQIGPFAKTAEDAALIFHALADKDVLDATSVATSYDELLELDLARAKKLRIGIPKEYFIDGIAPEVRAGVQGVIDTYRKLGFAIEEVSLPHTAYALSTYYIILPAEASSNLARFDGIRYGRHPELPNDFISERGYGFGPEVKRRIILGTFVLSSGYYDAYYKKAQAVRALVADDFKKVFERVDVLLTPTTPTLPFKLGEKSGNPLELYLQDIFTIPANLAGVPGLAMPVTQGRGTGTSELPIGFQLIGKHFREADILALGKVYEEA